MRTILRILTIREPGMATYTAVCEVGRQIGQFEPALIPCPFQWRNAAFYHRYCRPPEPACESRSIEANVIVRSTQYLL